MRLSARPIVLGLLSLASVATVIACLGDDPLPTGSQATDAGATGAIDGTTTPGADGAADAGSTAESVIRRGDFETGGCQGWDQNEALLKVDPDKHGGSFACQVCASGSTSVWGIFQDVPSAAAGGYLGHAFVRASGDAGPFATVLRLETFPGDGGEGRSNEGQVTIVPGESGWEELNAEIEVEPGEKVALAVLSSTAGGCFLVDDVTLVKR